MSAFQNKIKRVYLLHKEKCNIFCIHDAISYPDTAKILTTELGIPCETISFFRYWSVSVALVGMAYPSGDMGYMCIKFEYSDTLFLGVFPSGTLNYVSIRNHVFTIGGVKLTYVSIT